ncbi:hypothetical protein ACFXKD_10740 [Nocardiopsis aegyptia]|uniref:hypothetical protein n=1 Tax=Nocardiopsis aegyptia TaxID=220378 RepID=UPI00366FE755
MKITQEVRRYAEEHGLELQRHLVIDQSLLVLVVAASSTSLVMTSGQLGHGGAVGSRLVVRRWCALERG